MSSIGIQRLDSPVVLVDQLTHRGVNAVVAAGLVGKYYSCMIENNALASGMSVQSGSTVASVSTVGTRSSRRRQRREGYLAACADVVNDAGYCYLRMVKLTKRLVVKKKLGPFPDFYGLMTIYPDCLDVEALSGLQFECVGHRSFHLGLCDQGNALAVLGRTLHLLPNLQTPLRELIGEDDSPGLCLPVVARIGASDTSLKYEFFQKYITGLRPESADLMALRENDNKDFDGAVKAIKASSANASSDAEAIVVAETLVRQVQSGVWYQVVASLPVVLRVVGDVVVQFSDGSYDELNNAQMLVWLAAGTYKMPFMLVGNDIRAVFYAMTSVDITQYRDDLVVRAIGMWRQVFDGYDGYIAIPRDVAALLDVSTASLVEKSISLVLDAPMPAYAGIVVVLAKQDVLPVSRLYPHARLRHLDAVHGMLGSEVLLHLASDGSLKWSEDGAAIAISRHSSKLHIVGNRGSRFYATNVGSRLLAQWDSLNLSD